MRRRAYLDWNYWGRPVPSFGPLDARVLILGLAPGAHGANRTGRVFTGDRSGDFLFPVLHAAGFASQPTSISREDGLRLIDARITCAAHCAPPENKPLPQEILNCRMWLERELKLMPNVKVLVALGKVAFDDYLGLKRSQGRPVVRGAVPFRHGAIYRTDPADPILISSFHPSQQNTSTGRLTRPMFQSVFDQARAIVG